MKKHRNIPEEAHLRSAKRKTDRCNYDWLGSILLSVLCIEAIGNSYGKVLIRGWEDFERASPIAKLRLVAWQCGIKPDFGKEPWQTARIMIDFRNRIAHAKPEHLTRERDCSLSEDGSYFKMKLEGGLEKMISEEFAAKSYGAVEQIIRALNNTLKPSDLHELTSEGHEYYAQVSE